MEDSNKSKGSELSKPLLKRVTDFMKKKLHSTVNVGDMASTSNMSKFHFARSFKKTTGHSPHQYLTTMRLEKAIALLPGEMPLVEIASESGFSDQAHFTRVFKRHFGVTPAAYRRTLKQATKPQA